MQCKGIAFTPGLQMPSLKMACLNSGGWTAVDAVLVMTLDQHHGKCHQPCLNSATMQTPAATGDGQQSGRVMHSTFH